MTQTALAFLAGATLATALVWLWLAGRHAGVTAERDLLRERVGELSDAVADDSQTAQVLAPLRDALVRVERQVGVLERDRTGQYATLEAALGEVRTATQMLGRETASLAGSLNASSVRGSWGEVQLRRVLEHAGLLARCDFDEQVCRVSRHDAQVRPDVVVALPGERHLVIDAKAPMSAFLKAQAEDLSAEMRSALLQRHARDLRGHARALAAKDYWSAFDASPQMVVLFVPSDAMLSAALASEPGLHEEMLSERVVLVGPGSLLALLRTVAFTWQQQALTDSARELLALGQELYSRLGTLGGHTARLGGSLQRSVEAYNAMVGALESRVFVTARRMRDLDVVEGDLDAPQAVETAPRVMTAVELLDSVTAADARPELDLGAGSRPDRASNSRAAG
ncbi:DNA recombination protein RmuC [Actinomycetota bacterium]